ILTPKPGDRRPKLTPYRLICCAACFGTKQVVGDADRGDDCPDPARALHQGQDDQGDRPRPEGVAEHGPEGAEVGRDLVRVRAGGAAAAKAGQWASELDGLLAANAAKSAREQLTLIRIFEELRGRGYDGGYDAVRRYARRWSQERGQSTAAAYDRRFLERFCDVFAC